METFQEGLAESLSHGYRRMLGICMAKASNPKILLLDEPLAGLNEAEKEEIMKHIVSMREQNICVLLVEHNMKAVMNNCDRIVVLNFGKKIAEGSVQEIISNKEVIEAYLGAGSYNGATKS
jgi:branched-chain amino acid transport system ATP-binding protein